MVIIIDLLLVIDFIDYFTITLLPLVTTINYSLNLEPLVAIHQHSIIQEQLVAIHL